MPVAHACLWSRRQSSTTRSEVGESVIKDGLKRVSVQLASDAMLTEMEVHSDRSQCVGGTIGINARSVEACKDSFAGRGMRCDIGIGTGVIKKLHCQQRDCHTQFALCARQRVRAGVKCAFDGILVRFDFLTDRLRRMRAMMIQHHVRDFMMEDPSHRHQKQFISDARTGVTWLRCIRWSRSRPILAHVV